MCGSVDDTDALATINQDADIYTSVNKVPIVTGFISDFINEGGNKDMTIEDFAELIGDYFA